METTINTNAKETKMNAMTNVGMNGRDANGKIAAFAFICNGSLWFVRSDDASRSMVRVSCQTAIGLMMGIKAIKTINETLGCHEETIWTRH